MLKTIFCLLSILTITLCFAQRKDTSLVIVACTSGELVIDGESKGRVEADDAHKEKLAYGEHYIQLKTGSQKFNQTIKVSSNIASTIIRIGCPNEITGATNDTKGAVTLIDQLLRLNGVLTVNTDNNLLALDKGDELVITCKVLEKGTANISIVQNETGMDIYKKKSFEYIDHEHLKITVRGIYKIVLNTNALMGRNVHVTIDRIAAPGSRPDFKTSVHYVYDTTATDVLTTVVKVYPQNNTEHSNKSVLPISLPYNTTYWAYWIGASDEAREAYNSLSKKLPFKKGATAVSPLFYYGMQAIASLPLLASSSSLGYFFADGTNARHFMNGESYRPYDYKKGSNMINDFGVVKEGTRDVSLCFSNSSSLTGYEVEVRVMAFTVNKKVVMDEN